VPTRGVRTRRSLATWLLIPLLATVAVVMGTFAVWALVQRERTLAGEAHRETHAYATALGLALNAAFRDPQRTDVPQIVEHITRQPSVYAVLVYEADGQAILRRDTLDLGPRPLQVDSALADGGVREVERTIGDVDVFSVVYPILGDRDEVVGAFEVAQPLSFVREEMERTRIRFILNTLVLFLAVTALIQWLVRRLVSEPLRRLAEGAQAFGRGELQHRMRLGAGSGELAEVATEFNRMAQSLEQARTELVQGAEERLALARHVRHSEKMAALGQMAAGLAHEIGAPLHVVRGRADLLARRGSRPEQEARDLRIIVEQIDRITGIVHSLLGFARHREPDLTPVGVGEVVTTVVELLASETRRTEADIRIVPLPDATVRGDKDQLQQVLLNLLLNALQALGEAPPPRVVEVSGEVDSERNQVFIRVSDNGPGIPPGIRERVFEPFFTTKATGVGTGLGLAIARRIAEEHGGSVGVVPTERGTTMALALPLISGVSHGS